MITKVIIINEFNTEFKKTKCMPDLNEFFQNTKEMGAE